MRRIRLTEFVECLDGDDRPHSALMPAARITLPHFSVSSAMSLPKSAGEPRKHRAAEVGEPRLHLGIGEGRVDLVVELVDDFGGRVLGRADADTNRSPRSPARTRRRSERPAAPPSASRRSSPPSARSLPVLMCSDRARAWRRTSPALARRADRSALAPRRDTARAPCRRRPSS